jgi:hypothetical protein
MSDHAPHSSIDERSVPTVVGGVNLCPYLHQCVECEKVAEPVAIISAVSPLLLAALIFVPRRYNSPDRLRVIFPRGKK